MLTTTTEALPILIVDDDKLIGLALEEILKREGYRVCHAASGEEALECMNKQTFALILCDQWMPGMSGIEVLKQAQTIQPDATRIMLTAHSDMDTALQAINIGQVSQFIMKPWDNAQLMQTIAASMNKYRLVKENQHLQKLIVEQHQALAKNHEQLRRELKVGAQIHQTMLLGKIPERHPGFTIEAQSIPSQEIDGDFFEFYHPSSDVLDIVIGDVMGKGIPAALIGTALKTQIMRFAVPFTRSLTFTKQEQWTEDILSPEEILAHVHREIVPQLLQLEYFVSLFYGRFDIKKRSFRFLDCGFTKSIHYRARTRQIVPLAGNNFPLGFREEANYEPMETFFELGDFFVFYSDGVTETKSPDDELFCYDRVIHLVESHPESEPKSLIQNILNEVIAFAQKNSFDDDLTIMVIKITEEAAKIHEGDASALISAEPLVQHEEKLEKVSFRADLSQLRAVRDYIDRLCQKAPGNRQLFSGQLQLAINEAFCNIVKHGYVGESEGVVTFEGESKDEGLVIEISDRGQAFDPTQLEEPSFAGDKEGGFGWHLIKEITDIVTYIPKKSKEGWNHLRLYKKYCLEGNGMQFQHSKENDVLIITPQGKSLDAKDAPQFKENVIHLIETSQMSHVIFDLHELQFIDSSGLGTFLSVLRLLNHAGGELKLSCLNKPIRMMIELVSMHKIFEIYNTTQDAVRSFKR